MTNKEIGEMLDRNNLVRGYVYPHAGGRHDYWFDHSPENIANFIMQYKEACEIILADRHDNFILNTMGEFIDLCPDQALLKEILPHLIPMQMGEAEQQKIPVATTDDVEAYIEQKNEMDMQFGM